MTHTFLPVSHVIKYYTNNVYLTEFVHIPREFIRCPGMLRAVHQKLHGQGQHPTLRAGGV